jgi:DNA repair exonuclease SbcCD ATPase subunit
VNGKEDETCVKLGLAALKPAMKQGLDLAKEKLDLRNQLKAQRKLITDLTTHLDSFTAEKQAQLDLAQALLAEKIGELPERDEKIDEAFQLVSDNVTLRIRVRDQGMLLKETLGYVEKYEKRGTEPREQIADMAKRLAEKDRELARLKEVERELERVRKELEAKNKLINDFLLDGSGEPTKMGDLYIGRAVQQLAEQRMALEKKDKETEELTTKKDQEIKELTDQLRFLSHENATRTVRNEDDEITINDLKRQIEEYQQGGEGIITVEQCDAKLDEERAEFEAIMADYEDDNKNLEAQLELVEGIYKDETTNTKMLDDKVRELEGNVEELEETVQELVEQFDAQPVPVAPECQTGWLSSLFGVKEPPQEQLTLPQCYEKNKKRIESRDKRIQELEQQVEAANRMLQTTRQLVQLPVQDDRPLHEQIADLEGLIAHYKQEVDRQREELAARGLGTDFGPTEQYNFERIRELEQELKDTKDELEGLQGEELAKMRRLGHLEQEAKRLERELTSSQADKRKLNDDIRKLNGIIDKHKRDVREPRKHSSTLVSLYFSD